MYKMELKREEKIFLITMSGNMTEEDSISYLNDLKKNISLINSAQYSLVVDSKELATASQQLIGYIEEAMKLIAKTPFKQRYSIIPKSAIATMQIKRLGKETRLLDGTILVESFRDIVLSKSFIA